VLDGDEELFFKQGYKYCLVEDYNKMMKEIEEDSSEDEEQQSEDESLSGGWVSTHNDSIPTNNSTSHPTPINPPTSSISSNNPNENISNNPTHIDLNSNIPIRTQSTVNPPTPSTESSSQQSYSHSSSSFNPPTTMSLPLIHSTSLASTSWTLSAQTQSLDFADIGSNSPNQVDQQNPFHPQNNNNNNNNNNNSNDESYQKQNNNNNNNNNINQGNLQNLYQPSNSINSTATTTSKALHSADKTKGPATTSAPDEDLLSFVSHSAIRAKKLQKMENWEKLVVDVFRMKKKDPNHGEKGVWLHKSEIVRTLKEQGIGWGAGYNVKMVIHLHFVFFLFTFPCFV
jgi:hypothetical protein